MKKTPIAVPRLMTGAVLPPIQAIELATVREGEVC